LAIDTEAADFQGVVGSFEPVVSRQPADMLFYRPIFRQVDYLAAIDATEVVVMVPEHVTEFYLGLLAEAQASDDTEPLEQVHVAVHGDLVVLGQQPYQFLHR
jgi:hypothetical protein